MSYGMSGRAAIEESVLAPERRRVPAYPERLSMRIGEEVSRGLFELAAEWRLPVSKVARILIVEGLQRHQPSSPPGSTA